MNFVEIGCNTFWFDNGIKYFVTYILGGLQSPHGCTVGKASKPFFSSLTIFYYPFSIVNAVSLVFLTQALVVELSWDEGFITAILGPAVLSVEYIPGWLWLSVHHCGIFTRFSSSSI